MIEDTVGTYFRYGGHKSPPDIETKNVKDKRKWSRYRKISANATSRERGWVLEEQSKGRGT